MATCLEFEGKRPVVDPSAWLAPTAVLIGDVEIGAEASVWYGAVLRGDFDRIVVGARSSVQDNAVIHAAPGQPTLVGEGVTVGHGALLEGCAIRAGALVGMGAIALRDSELGEGALLAAGAVLAEGRRIDAGMIAAGTPARPVKRLTGAAAAHVEGGSAAYVSLSRRYRAAGL